MIVLHEADAPPQLRVQAVLVEALEEAAALVAEHLGFDQHDVRDGQGGEFHDASEFLPGGFTVILAPGAALQGMRPRGQGIHDRIQVDLPVGQLGLQGIA